jgi:hypothetical protein
MTTEYSMQGRHRDEKITQLVWSLQESHTTIHHHQTIQLGLLLFFA